MPGSAPLLYGNDIEGTKGVTLAARLIADTGLPILLEAPHFRSLVRVLVADLDVSSSYPNGEAALNISKENTVAELISMEGVSEEDLRMQVLNFSAGANNAVEFATTLFNFPTPEELSELFDKERTVA